MRGLLYSASFENVSMTDAAQDIILVAAGSTNPLWIHSIRLSSDVTTDVRARLQLLRRTTAGSSGTAVTARALEERNSVAAAATITTLRTTQGTAGNILDSERWSLLVPFERLYTPEKRIKVSAAGFLALALVAATGAARNISGEITFEEA